MATLEPRIEAIRKEYGLQESDFWKIKQNGQWVCKHAALEIIAVKAKVEWLPPQIIEANAPALVTSMIVTGKMGDRTEWSTGETNATNYSVTGKQPAYPWAMSEKRAKDRVVLKLVGIHGLVYSEDEAEDFKEPQKPTESVTQPVSTFPKHISAIATSTTLSELKTAFDAAKADKTLSKNEVDDILTAKDAQKETLSAPDGYVAPKFDHLADALGRDD